ncbi:MAG: ATP-binding cassette domain-containing protein [Polyangiales bacterium]|nr:ATP-binding cassette domain-containing protein [Sandaracinaceae bacterium]
MAFGSQRVLRDISLELPARGVVLLLGSAGEGKSTLLRTLAGLNDAQPSLRTWGLAHFPDERPVLVRQNARLLLSTLHENLVSGLASRAQLTRAEQTRVLGEHLARLGLSTLIGRLADDVSSLPRAEQRLASIARALLANPSTLLLDEPTAGLLDDEPGAHRILELILREARQRLMIVTTHNQRHARMLGGEVVLLADGTVHLRGRTQHFFDHPTTPEARSFVRSGRCSSVKADPSEDAAQGTPPPVTSRQAGPQGFYWLLRGKLGGTQRPGITSELNWDLDALGRLGTTTLVSLEERLYYDVAALAPYGIRSREFPIEDMGAPDPASAAVFCGSVADSLAAGEVLVFHCRAGMGRTGTMLAAQLIWSGAPPVDAIERVRAINPRWIQSDAQISFLSTFNGHVRHALQTHHKAENRETIA